jgi:thioredoxin reductase (NADPH)
MPLPKPILFAIDDDPQVLAAVVRDLRRRYSKTYSVLQALSGEIALDALKKLVLRPGETVALFLSDQRMPGMTGVEFLQEARAIFPDARRVLLTAYTDTEAAIQAINGAKVDYYQQKPWDPAEERLFPVLDRVLDAWTDPRPRESFDGIRVIGHRWSREYHQIKDFLARNLIDYQPIDVASDNLEPGMKTIVEAVGVDAKLECLPLVLFPDGTRLASPTIAEVAAKVGLSTLPKNAFYDVVIIGAGPAGLAAGVYAGSEGLKALIIEREAPGGQAGTSSRIENYLGFPEGISGKLLTQYARDQATKFGVEILAPQEVQSLRIEDKYRIVTLTTGEEISTYVVLIASGVQYVKVRAPGMEQLTGRGVYYGAAMTEALSCKDDDVFLIGGANSAGQAALFFARYARTVNMIVRGDSLEKSMSQYLIDAICKTPNIKVRLHSEITEAHGSDHLEAVTVIRRDADGALVETTKEYAHALFIFIGAAPQTTYLDGIVARDPKGFILAGPDLKKDGKMPKSWTPERDPYLLETSVPGVFVAGDAQSGSVKRVASGVGAGAIAISFIHQYLASVR